ncbi:MULTISPECIES: hypothetical protein [unclassified Treponema]|nr:MULTISPECIES: hypothetical protein [unclassified Treponema]
MAKKKSVWEVYLRPNTLTKDNDRDCIADVHAHSYGYAKDQYQRL